MTRTRRGAGLAEAVLPLLVASVLLAAGCGTGNPTEVIIVVQSDLTIPNDVDGIDITSVAGPFAPAASPSFDSVQPVGGFPHLISLWPDGVSSDVSVVVRLFRDVFDGTTPALLASRTVTDLRFVSQHTMMLMLPMDRACTCQGTSCPTTDNAQCDNLDRPTLQPFDPAIVSPRP